jgi:hypothetical protein
LHTPSTATAASATPLWSVEQREQPLDHERARHCRRRGGGWRASAARRRHRRVVGKERVELVRAQHVAQRTQRVAADRNAVFVQHRQQQRQKRPRLVDARLRAVEAERAHRRRAHRRKAVRQRRHNHSGEQALEHAGAHTRRDARRRRARDAKHLLDHDEAAQQHARLARRQLPRALGVLGGARTTHRLGLARAQHVDVALHLLALGLDGGGALEALLLHELLLLAAAAAPACLELAHLRRLGCSATDSSSARRAAASARPATPATAAWRCRAPSRRRAALQRRRRVVKVERLADLGDRLDDKVTEFGDRARHVAQQQQRRRQHADRHGARREHACAASAVSARRPTSSCRSSVRHVHSSCVATNSLAWLTRISSAKRLSSGANASLAP